MNGIAPFFAALIVAAAAVFSPPGPVMLPGGGPPVREEVVLGSSSRAKFSPMAPFLFASRRYPISTVGQPRATIPP